MDAARAPVNLWEAFHDGTVSRLVSNAVPAAIKFDLRVAHVNALKKWPEETQLAVTAYGPGEPSVVETTGGQRRIWTSSEMEAFFAADLAVGVLEAELQAGVLQLCGELVERDAWCIDDRWVEVQIPFETMTIETPDGPTDLDGLREIGEAYWGSFGKREGAS